MLRLRGRAVSASEAAEGDEEGRLHRRLPKHARCVCRRPCRAGRAWQAVMALICTWLPPLRPEKHRPAKGVRSIGPGIGTTATATAPTPGAANHNPKQTCCIQHATLRLLARWQARLPGRPAPSGGRLPPRPPPPALALSALPEPLAGPHGATRTGGNKVFHACWLPARGYVHGSALPAPFPSPTHPPGPAALVGQVRAPGVPALGCHVGHGSDLQGGCGQRRLGLQAAPPPRESGLVGAKAGVCVGAACEGLHTGSY